MATESTEALIQQKLAAFDQIHTAFTASFRFVQALHGQQRFDRLSVGDAVRYLKGRWLIECKDRLLSVSRTMRLREGQRCLELLTAWQQGDTASVVDYLQLRLDTEPFALITQQIHDAAKDANGSGLVERLTHGRLVLLNRGMNLMHLLEAIFMQPEAELLQEVRTLCANEGLTPANIATYLAEFSSPLYAHLPHPALAQRNMLVMNDLGINVLERPEDLPGLRSWRVNAATEMAGAFAETFIADYHELSAPWHNNVQGVRFADLLKRGEVAPSEVVVAVEPNIATQPE